MTIFEVIKRAFVSEKTPTPESKLMKNFGFASEQNDVPFKKLIDYHDRTPELQMAVAGYSKLINFPSLQINSDNEKAKKIIEEWNRETNFIDKGESLINTLLICGSTILEKLDEKIIIDVKEVDMSSITGKRRDEYGTTLYYEQNGTDKLGEGHITKYIEFSLTPSSVDAWGKSLFHSATLSRKVGNRTIFPLVEIWWAIQDAEAMIMINHGYPNEYLIFPGATEEQLLKEQQKLMKRKPGDKIISTMDFIHKIVETNGEAKYVDYVKDVRNSIQLACKFPFDIMTGDFTSRASSNTSEDITLKITRGFQRYISNKLLHELYNPILEQNGISPQEANLSVTFTTQDILKLSPLDVSQLVEKKQLSIEEGREYLKDNTSLDLFDDDIINNDKDMQDQQQQVDLEIKKVQAINQTKKDAMANLKKETDLKIENQNNIISNLQNMIKERDLKESSEKAKLTREILDKLRELK